MIPADFTHVPIVIICRDRLAPLLQLLDWLHAAGYERVMLVDNGSTYPPLTDFFGTTEAEVVRLERNLGRFSPWSSEVRARLDPDSPFVVTDCDVVPDRNCPPDVVEHLAGLLLRHADIDKAGLGLRIDDLPDCFSFKTDVIAWESQYWESEIAPGVFRAAVDTTFALYRSPSEPFGIDRALRTGPPYVAHHLPWYTDSACPTEEDRYYVAHAEPSLTHWTGGHEGANFRRNLARLRRRQATREIVQRAGNPLLVPWMEEPATVDEGAFTPGATPGWSAWNNMSPEAEFCDFVATLTRLIHPAVVIETGVGQGFTTRRLAAQLEPDQQLLAFEADPDLRAHLGTLPFFSLDNHRLGSTPSPSEKDFARADVTVLHSGFPARVHEFDTWVAATRPGAILVVHDATDRHGPDSPQGVMRRHIEECGLSGSFLKNPRGGFLAVQTREASLRAELAREQEDRARAQGELAGIRSSRAYRLIGMRGRAGRSIRGRFG